MNRFRKRERITSHRQIDLLFGGSQSKSFVAYPLRAVWTMSADSQDNSLDTDEPAADCVPAEKDMPQVLISVPKKRLRHAVDRNRAKRQIREAYRLNRRLLLTALPPGSRLSVAFVWLADHPEPSALVSSRVTKLLQRIGESL